MQAQLTYVQAHSGEIRRFRRELSFAELETFALRMVEGYAPYASLLPEEWRSYRLTEQAGSGKEWTGHEF